MNEEFARRISNDNKLKDVSELPMGVVMDRTNVMIPLCCKEGWDSCPHIPRKQRNTKTNIGL